MKKWFYAIGTLSMFILSMFSLYEHNISAFAGWLVAFFGYIVPTMEKWIDDRGERGQAGEPNPSRERSEKKT